MSEIALQARSERQRWAAPGSSHDRLVTIMQAVLPMAIGVLAAFVVLSPLLKGGDTSFLLDKNKVAVARERLKVQSAQYSGEDDKGRPFLLSVGSAVQQTSAHPVVQLNDLAATMELADGPAHLTAPAGVYDMDQQRIAVEGPIAFRAADGYSLDTSGATVNLRNQTMTSDSAVNGQTPMGSFSADSMQANLSDHVVRLDGNARLRIVPKRANRK